MVTSPPNSPCVAATNCGYIGILNDLIQNRPERNLASLEGFVARMDVLPLGDSATGHAGQIRAELAKLGMPIGPYDQMIDCHARSLVLVLVTNNEKEFSRVSVLRLENWVSH